MLDVYFEKRAQKPVLQLDYSTFAPYWDVLQEFSSTSGVEFSFYRDFSLNSSQCRFLAELLENKNIFEDSTNISVFKFVLILWKANAMDKSIFLVGD